MRIFWEIQYGDDKEVESLLSDVKTNMNWTNEFFRVSVIIVEISWFMIFYNIYDLIIIIEYPFYYDGIY